MKGRKQFTFYRSYYDALMLLPEDLWAGILVSIMEYGLFGKEPEDLDPVQKACFILIKPTLETGIKRAAATKKLNFDEKINFNKGEKEKEKENEIEIESEYEESAGEDFESFWDLYPVKMGKQAAWEAWKSVCPDAREVLEGLDRWQGSRQWKQEDGRFIPRAAKFLLEKHYLETPKQAVPMGATGKLGEAELDAIRQMMEGD